MKISKEQFNKLPEDLKNYFYQECNFHCTTKPIKLMEYLINMVSREWQVVLDPFMWSWTTAIACENLNRKWIWIEKDETYFNIWVERINNLNLK